jgi:stage II sporulation protein AB (anti-sigma F factor)
MTGENLVDAKQDLRNSMVLEVMNLTKNVALARVAVACFASQVDFTVAELDELKVAVSEAVTNAVLHAYDGPGKIRITALREGDCITVEVRDFGKGIPDVGQARQPSFTTVPGRMGLGFTFMESLSDEMSVESQTGEGTRVRLRKCLEPRDTGKDGVERGSAW